MNTDQRYLQHMQNQLGPNSNQQPYDPSGPLQVVSATVHFTDEDVARIADAIVARLKAEWPQR